MNSLQAGVFVGFYAAKHPLRSDYGGAGEFRGSKMTLEFSSRVFFRAHSRNPRRRVAAATEEGRFIRRQRVFFHSGPKNLKNSVDTLSRCLIKTAFHFG